MTVDHGVTGFLARPFEICDYAAHVVRLLVDPALNDRMGRAGMKRVRRCFTWDRHVAMIAEEPAKAGVNV